jgi:hypothetical protein
MYKILFSLFLIVVMSFACKKLGYDADPNEVTSNGDYISDTLYAVSDSVVRKGDVYTGLSSKFVLGQRDGLNAGFLVNFTFLDTLDSIDSVYLVFTTLNSYGADLVDRISANIYSVDSIWGGAANQYDRYRNPPVENMEFVTRGTFNTADSSKSTFKIPLDFNNIWLGLNDSIPDTVRFNLFFQPETGNENAVVELGSYVSNQNPYLVYYKVYEDTTIIDTISTVVGATVFNYDAVSGSALNYPPEDVIVSSGIIYHPLFKFDFSGLPEDAIYYKASLELSEDDMNDYENNDNKSSFELAMVESFADTSYAPTYTLSLKSEEGMTKVSGTSTNLMGEDFVQEIVNKSFSNEWLELSFLTEDQDFSIKRFWGIKCPDPLKRPRLIISYLDAKK